MQINTDLNHQFTLDGVTLVINRFEFTMEAGQKNRQVSLSITVDKDLPPHVHIFEFADSLVTIDRFSRFYHKLADMSETYGTCLALCDTCNLEITTPTNVCYTGTFDINTLAITNFGSLVEDHEEENGREKETGFSVTI